MALNLYLELTAGGIKVEGEPTEPPAGRENDIECFSFESSVALTRAAGTMTSTGRRKHDAIVVTKRIDKSTPRIAQALVANDRSLGAIFRFFRADPLGQSAHFYTVEIREAGITSQKHLSPETFDPVKRDLPAIEVVSFIFERIIWRNEDPEVVFEDNTIGSGP
jgi:type VI secretion system secreted protein Hcp